MKLDIERLEICIQKLEIYEEQLTQIKDKIISVDEQLEGLGIRLNLDYSGDIEYFVGYAAERLRKEFDLNE